MYEPFPECLARWTGFALQKAAERGREFYEKAIVPLKISREQLSILVVLEDLGPLVQAHLAYITRIDRAVMVSLAGDLESKGLIKRQPNPSDKRAYLISVTSEGLSTIKKALKVSEDLTALFFAGFTPVEIEDLRRMLLKIANYEESRSSVTKGS
jgi:DNA-binding MarR family transcriptional regulator